MKRECIRVQGQISEGHLGVAAQEHVEECQICSAFQSRLLEVDALFRELPEYEVPEHVTSAILAVTTKQGDVSQGRVGWNNRRQLLVGFVAASILVVCATSIWAYIRLLLALVLSYFLYRKVQQFQYVGSRLAGPVAAGSLVFMVVLYQGLSMVGDPSASYRSRGVQKLAPEVGSMESKRVYNDLRFNPEEEVADEYSPSVSEVAPTRQEADARKFDRGDLDQLSEDRDLSDLLGASQATLNRRMPQEGTTNYHHDQINAGVLPSRKSIPLPWSKGAAKEEAKKGVKDQGSVSRIPGFLVDVPFREESIPDFARPAAAPPVLGGVEDFAAAPKNELGKQAFQEATEGLEYMHSPKSRFMDNGRRRDKLNEVVAEADDQRDFYARERGKIRNLSFVDARGYWSNSYIPGDRRLRRSFQAVDRWLGGLKGGALEPLQSLYEDVRKMEQPLDAPIDGALSLTLQTDTAYAEGIKRLLVQVSIGAAQRAKEYRAPMNVALVLDVDGLSPDHEAIAQYRKILLGLSLLKEVGDNFSIVLTGASGGVVVGASEFRHGTVQVLSDNLGKASAATKGSGAVSLLDALKHASEEIKRSGVNALGRSLVVVATHRQELTSVHELVDFSHQMAAEGMVVSAFSLDGGNLPSLEAVALGGQGNRRVFTSKHDARELWKEELASVSRVVARALRLKVKLAPGVKLIEVLGARRLSVEQKEQVKRVEKTIDRMISREFGIKEDRGDDQDGIQILIPAFYSGDAHVVLFDVLVDGPGTVAEAELKFKDLVDLNNATLRTSVALGSNPVEPSPLNLNVVKNHFAYLFSQVMKDMSSDISSDQTNERALASLVRLEQLLSSVQASFVQLRGDPELEMDRKVIAKLTNILRVNKDVLKNRTLFQLYLYMLSQLKLLPRPERELAE